MTPYIDTAPRKINANTKSLVWWPVGPYTAGGIQIEPEGIAGWSTAVVEIKWSNDGVRFYPISSPATTIGAAGVVTLSDISGVAYIGAEVTTAEGSALILNAWGCFKAAIIP